MGGGRWHESTERTRQIKLHNPLNDPAELRLYEGKREHTIEVSANSSDVRVGCTTISRAAWDEIVQRVERLSTK